jgi:hypothetical protein
MNAEQHLRELTSELDDKDKEQVVNRLFRLAWMWRWRWVFRSALGMLVLASLSAPLLDHSLDEQVTAADLLSMGFIAGIVMCLLLYTFLETRLGGAAARHTWLEPRPIGPHFSLAALLVGVLVLAVVLGLNTMDYNHDNISPNTRGYAGPRKVFLIERQDFGCPLRVLRLSTGVEWDGSQEHRIVSNYKWHWSGLLGNTVVSLLAAFTGLAVCESILRRRGKNKKAPAQAIGDS